jgi:hypothetical protein
MRNVVALSKINIPRSPEILGFLAEIQFPRLRGALIPFSRDTVGPGVALMNEQRARDLPDAL